MSSAISLQESEVIEGILENQNSLSQHQAELFQDDNCEFATDEEVIADWLQSKSEKTAKTYWSVVRQFHTFSGKATIGLWTKKLILAYIESRKKKDKIATVNKKLTTLRSLLSHCVKEGYLIRNVASNISTVKEDKSDITKQSLTATERIIGSEEVWKLINAAKEGRDRLLLKTTYLLGLRAHEAVKLHWNDITPSGKGYKVRIIGKNNKLAFLPIDKQLLSELRELSTEGYIFQSRKGKGKLSTVHLHRIIKEAAIKAGLSPQISAHWLRHQRCSDLVNSGQFTLSQVQKFMRHSSPNTTAGYVHITEEISSNALL